MEDSKAEQISDIRLPIVTIDESLDKYDDIVLSPEKQAKYDQLLRTAGHPEDALQRLIKIGKIR